LTYIDSYGNLYSMRERQTYLEKHIREAIKDSGLTIYRLAKDSGVSQPVLCRFVNRKRGINLTTASKLLEALGLELVQKKNKKKKAPVGM